MAFRIDDFIRTNKTIFIWSAFFCFLFLVRRFFGLVFMTFILCFIFNNMIQWLGRRIRIRRRLWTVFFYLLLLSLAFSLLANIGPKLGAESKAFFNQAPAIIADLQSYLDKLGDWQPGLKPLLTRWKQESLEEVWGIDRQEIISLLIRSFNQITHYSSYFLLSVLFSFLILYDFPNLRQQAKALRETRLKEVYEETAESVIQFALVVGEAFQAQILIAAINTLLTGLGLWILGIHPIAMLLTVVFFAGLIPVLGVFISSVPILLLAFNIGQVSLALGALVMIILIHLIEAYILNPNIFSAVFRINPVLTLFILYIGHSLFGLWGVVLGIPIAVFVFRYAILGHRMETAETGSEKESAGKSCPP